MPADYVTQTKTFCLRGDILLLAIGSNGGDPGLSCGMLCTDQWRPWNAYKAVQMFKANLLDELVAITVPASCGLFVVRDLRQVLSPSTLVRYEQEVGEELDDALEDEGDILLENHYCEVPDEQFVRCDDCMAVITSNGIRFEFLVGELHMHTATLDLNWPERLLEHVSQGEDHERYADAAGARDKNTEPMRALKQHVLKDVEGAVRGRMVPSWVYVSREEASRVL